MAELMLTKAGLHELETELERLRTARAQTDARLHETGHRVGDAGEVAEYLDAQRELELLEGRIAVVEERLASAQLLEEVAAGSERVTLGSRVELEDLDSGEHSRWLLVNSAEANPSEGRLSIESPVGRAVVDHEAMDVVEVVTPRGKRHLRVVGSGSTLRSRGARCPLV